MLVIKYASQPVIFFPYSKPILTFISNFVVIICILFLKKSFLICVSLWAHLFPRLSSNSEGDALALVLQQERSKMLYVLLNMPEIDGTMRLPQVKTYRRENSTWPSHDMNYCIVQYIESIYKEYISKKKTTYLCLPALSKLKKQTNKNVSCDQSLQGMKESWSGCQKSVPHSTWA